MAVRNGYWRLQGEKVSCFDLTWATLPTPGLGGATPVWAGSASSSPSSPKKNTGSDIIPQTNRRAYWASPE